MPSFWLANAYRKASQLVQLFQDPRASLFHITTVTYEVQHLQLSFPPFCTSLLPSPNSYSNSSNSVRSFDKLLNCDRISHPALLRCRTRKKRSRRSLFLSFSKMTPRSNWQESTWTESYAANSYRKRSSSQLRRKALASAQSSLAGTCMIRHTSRS